MKTISPRGWFAACLLAVAFVLANPVSVSAADLTVTDIAGRTVTVRQPANRVILGEGRQLYMLATLETENPFRRVVGWRDDFRGVDPTGYRAYQRKFPAIDTIPQFGNPAAGGFSIEKAIELKPDVVFLNLEVLRAVTDSGMISKLEAVGIPVVFLDFRERPLENTIPSVLLAGRILDRAQRAQEVVDFQYQEASRVYRKIDGFKGQRPKVFIERAAGGGFFKEDCCSTWGEESLGMIVSKAGGINIAASLLPGPTGTLNPEQVMVSKPDVMIVTGSDWDTFKPGNTAAPLGAAADPKVVEQRLQKLATRYGFESLPAVKNGRYHAVWHQFYNSPYMFVALQAFAKWLHPAEFKDLDPDETFKRFHSRFLPVEYEGGYFATLGSNS
jgi:iron complex transport system substrate-binding protein